MRDLHSSGVVSARAPVRISFGGGGTDLPAYYERFGGFVISTSIRRFSWATVMPSRDRGVSVQSADYSVFRRIACTGREPLEHEPLPLAVAAVNVLTRLGILTAGTRLKMETRAEIQPGTGLGSSSSMAVAVTAALSRAAGVSLSRGQIAEIACRLEIEEMGLPIGKQDQYASVFGGLNAIDIGEKVTLRRLRIGAGMKRQLRSRVLLFASGVSAASSDVLNGQRLATQEDPSVLERLHRMKALAYAMQAAVERGDIDRLGQLLHESWVEKRQVSRGVSAPWIDMAYEAAQRAGALGGKITGAGGRGHLVVVSKDGCSTSIKAALSDLGIREQPFEWDDAGVVCYSQGEPRQRTSGPAPSSLQADWASGRTSTSSTPTAFLLHAMRESR